MNICCNIPEQITTQRLTPRRGNHFSLSNKTFWAIDPLAHTHSHSQPRNLTQWITHKSPLMALSRPALPLSPARSPVPHLHRRGLTCPSSQQPCICVFSSVIIRKLSVFSLRFLWCTSWPTFFDHREWTLEMTQGSYRFHLCHGLVNVTLLMQHISNSFYSTFLELGNEIF